jgi:hypothetical protein
MEYHLPYVLLNKQSSQEDTDMTRKKLSTVIAWGAVAMTALALTGAWAQDPGPAAGRPGWMHFEGARPFSGGKVVAGAPYSAQAVTEHIQTLADGNTIHSTTTVNVYRDTQGRTRREQEIGAVGSWAASGTPHKVITITDPVAGLIHTLSPDTQTDRQMPFRSHNGAGEENGAGMQARQRPENPNVKTESLGTQTIAGVAAEGTRMTRTIPAGQVGNAAPLVVTIERWYSPELQTDVMRKEVNPQFGQTTFQLTNVVRAEPEASLFQVPSTYTVKSGRSFRANDPTPKPSEQQ